MFKRSPSQVLLQKVEEFEALLLCNPRDIQARGFLMNLYFMWPSSVWEDILQKVFGTEKIFRRVTTRLHFHAKWIIKNAPDSYVAGTLQNFLFDQFSPRFYGECKQLWLEVLEKSEDDVLLLLNAARFFSNSDRALAENYLVKAVELEPGNVNCAEELDYFQAMQTKDWKRMWDNRIKWAQRQIRDASTPEQASRFIKLLNYYQQELEKLANQTP